MNSSPPFSPSIWKPEDPWSNRTPRKLLPSAGEAAEPYPTLFWSARSLKPPAPLTNMPTLHPLICGLMSTTFSLKTLTPVSPPVPVFAGVRSVEHCVSVAIGVAGVALPVSVGVGLICVGDGIAVVGGVRNAVAVRVRRRWWGLASVEAGVVGKQPVGAGQGQGVVSGGQVGRKRPGDVGSLGAGDAQRLGSQRDVVDHRAHTHPGGAVGPRLDVDAHGVGGLADGEVEGAGGGGFVPPYGLTTAGGRIVHHCAPGTHPCLLGLHLRQLAGVR